MQKNLSGGKRSLHVKVKTAKGRKKSSTRWLQRQLNDPYVAQSKIDGYRSRAAYKLIEINDKFKIFKPGQNIVDLGAAPGSWLQVAQKFASNSNIIGVDLLDIAPLSDVHLIKGDFTEEEIFSSLENIVGDKKLDIVMSDMAPYSCGHSATDHIRIIYLCEMAFEFAKNNLKEGGCFIAKVLQGGMETGLLGEIKKSFKQIKHIKPDASRKDSSEKYIVARDFIGN